jgi:hypothetical protein
MKNWKTKNGTTIIRVLSERSNAYLVIKEQIVILLFFATPKNMFVSI